MLRSLSLILCLAWCMPVAAYNLTEIPGMLECPDLSNSQKCATRFESLLLRKYNNLFKRNKQGLAVKIGSGKTVFIPDQNKSLDVVEYNPQTKYAIVRVQFGEGNTWRVISLKDGSITEIGGYPLFSPDAQFFVATELDLIAGYSLNVLRIYKVTDSTPKLVWDAKIDKENWGSSQPMWKSNSSFTFKKVSLRRPVPSKRFNYDETLMKVEIINGKWVMRPST
jgi:hypothetical protein